MRFLIDMNMSPRWPEYFQQAGLEATHWSKLGDADAEDKDIMAYAARHEFVVFTNDLDFGHLLAMTNAHKPSVVQVRVGNLRPILLGKRVAEMLQQLVEELEAGALVTIDPKRTRVRSLPLR